MTTRRRRTTLHCTPLEAREVPTVGVIPNVTPFVPQETQTAAALPSTTLNGFTYFIGSDADHGTELWRSDGTAAGTRVVADLTTGTGSTNITKIVVAGGKIVFAADPVDDVRGPQLYTTDGTEAGTALLSHQAFFSEFDPNVKISVADGLIGTADAVFWSGFAENGDGSLRLTGFRTPVGGADEGQSSELAFSNQNLNSPNNFVGVPGGAVFIGVGNAITGRGLFFSNGTSGAQLLKSDTFDKPFQRVVPVNGGAAALRPVDAAFSDYEVIFTNGTGAGTRRIGTAAGVDIALPDGTKLLGGLVSAGGKAYFTARAADGVDELWVTEGTEGSTLMLGRFNPDANDAPLRLLRTDGNKLYFPAYDSQHLGIEMWTSDGTVAGTRMVADLAPGAESSVGMYLQTADAVIPQADGIVYFLANAGGSAASDFRLYRTDGTPGGTFAIETGDTLANFAVTNQFYLGSAGGSILFRTGEQSSRLAVADSSSANAAATTTSVGMLVSYSEDIGRVTVTVLAAVRDAANEPVAGTVTIEFNGSTYPPVTLVDGNASVGDGLTLTEFQQLLAGNLPAIRATFHPADAQQFRPSTGTSSDASLVLFDESIVTVSEPVLAGPAYVGETVGVISQVTVNPALAEAFADVPLKIEYAAMRSPELTVISDLGHRDFAAGAVTYTTSALPVEGTYFLQTNVVGPTGWVIRSTGKFVGVSEAPDAAVTDITLTIRMNRYFVNDVPLVLYVDANVSSPTATPVGEVRLTFMGITQLLPLDAEGSVSVEFPLTFDQLRDMLTNGSPNFSAEFVPTDARQFKPDNASTSHIFGIVLAETTNLTAEPNELTVGENLLISTRVSSFTLPDDILRFLKVQFTLLKDGSAVELAPASLGADKTAEASGTTELLSPGEYTVVSEIVSPDGLIFIAAGEQTSFTLNARQVAVDTTTSLTVRVRDVNIFAGATVDVTADVAAVSGTLQPSGTVQITVGGRTIPVEVTNGTGTVVNQTIAISEFLQVYQNNGNGLTGTFIPSNQAEFISSDVTGGTIILPESLLTFTAPVLNPSRVVPGQSASIRSRVEFAPGVPAIPGLTVTFVAGGAAGRFDLATVNVVNGAAQTPRDYEFPLTVPLGDYELVAVLNAGDKISFGTSLGTAIKVVADSGTGYPNIPLAPKYTALATSNAVAVRDADESVVATIPLSGDFARNAEVAVGANSAGEAVLAVGTGPGSASHVLLYSGGTQIGELAPFEASFLGGVYVAKGDLDGDGEPETIISPNLGGGPRVIVLDGKTNAIRFDFFGIDDPAFRGGARCSAGDVNGDGVADLIVAAGFQGGPRVSVYDGRSIMAGTPVKLFSDFFAFEQTLRNGIFVATGDVDGDGFADVIAGGGPGGGPRVLAISGFDLVQSGGATLTPLANFFAGEDSIRNGVRVAVKNQDGDGRADIVTAFVGSSKARVYPGAGLSPTIARPAYIELDGDFTDGLNVG